jgi:hypothetical protein
VDGFDENQRAELHSLGGWKAPDVHRLGRWKPSAVLDRKLRHILVILASPNCYKSVIYLFALAITTGMIKFAQQSSTIYASL